MTFVDTSRRALLARMRSIVSAHSERTAVRSSKARVSYGDFSRLIGWLCRELRSPPRAGRGPVGLMLDRSATAYAAMWAAIALGRPYVPLNARYPHSRLQSIVRQAGVQAVICTEADRDLAIRLGIAPACAVVAESVIPPVGPGGSPDDWSEVGDDGRIAYILFTSGSTGEPKGVPISYENLHRFIENLDSIIDYRSDDVCSQVCELSFDFSVHEIYLALLNGCALCPARQIDLFNPTRYVAENGITVWVSVPSLARVALHNGLSGEDLGTVRLSVFNGEALTGQLARNWHAAAHRSEIWNTYGPTECTVAVTAQRWRDVSELCEAGVVSIGAAFSDCTPALLAGEEIVPVATATNGRVGELLLATPQCFDGYLDPGVASPFIRDGSGLRYYRTGDRVLMKGTRLYFLDRLDHQVKIGGHRIELLEVEHRLRRHLGTDALAVIAHPRRQPTRLVLFLAAVGQEAPKLTTEELGLPGYMMPRQSFLLDALPVTTHGKLDRDALHARLEGGS